MTNTPNIGPPAASPRRRETPVARPTLTADEQAERAVTRADSGMLVLTAPGVPPVTLGPYPNPDVLRSRLAAVRQFVAALIRSTRTATLDAESSPKRRQDGGFAADCDLHQMTDDGCPLSPDPTRWVDANWCDAIDAEGTSPLSSSPRKA